MRLNLQAPVPKNLSLAPSFARDAPSQPILQCGTAGPALIERRYNKLTHYFQSLPIQPDGDIVFNRFFSPEVRAVKFRILLALLTSASLAWLLNATLASVPPLEAASKPIDFDRQIRPILSDTCFADRKSTRLNSSHSRASRMPSSA